MIAIGLFLGHAHAQDILTPALDKDLTWEWANRFSSCVRALQYHGDAKDDRALDVLSANARDAAAREHYAIAQSRPKDAFWKQVATAGATPVDCEKDLSTALDRHFAAAPKALGKADDDAATSNFLALFDLLSSIPADSDHETAANTYRFCFSDSDSLLAMVKRKLGRTP